MIGAGAAPPLGTPRQSHHARHGTKSPVPSWIYCNDRRAMDGGSGPVRRPKAAIVVVAILAAVAVALFGPSLPQSRTPPPTVFTGPDVRAIATRAPTSS